MSVRHVWSEDGGGGREGGQEGGGQWKGGISPMDMMECLGGHEVTELL